MLLFLILAGLISSGAALLVLLGAARAGRPGAAVDPTVEVYRRQLAEIDELVDRGLLGDDERRAAHAEAGRRLLSEAERPDARPQGLSPKTGRRLVLAAAIAAPIVALAAYLMTGSPGLPDMPYQDRLKSWKAVSASDPGRLGLPQMAAVLASETKATPNDPQPLYYLGVVERAEGDLAASIRHLEKAADLSPGDAKVWAALGTALVERDQDQVGPAAEDAFRRSVALDPTALQPRYFLARAEIAGGHAAAGLAAWRVLLAGLPAQDPRRAALQAEIDQVTSTGKLDVAQAPSGQDRSAEAGQQSQFIQSMVARQAAELKARPDDPAGWARLIRAYGVLHQADRQTAAIAEAQRLFKDRPGDLSTALQGQSAPTPAPPPPG